MTLERLQEIEQLYLEAEEFYQGKNDLGMVVLESVIPLSHRHCGELIQEIKAMESLKHELEALRNSLKGFLLKDEVFYYIWKKFSDAPMRPGESFKDFEIRVEAECHEVTNSIILSLQRKFPV